MERGQNIKRPAMRQGSSDTVSPRTKTNLQELFINVWLILICLLFIYIIVLLM